jgi:hypothetical protein
LSGNKNSRKTKAGMKRSAMTEKAALQGQGILAQGKRQKNFGAAPPWVNEPAAL